MTTMKSSRHYVLPKMGENNNTCTLSCWSVKTLTLSWLGMMYEIKISRISQSVIQRPECEQSSTLGANTVLWHTFWMATECYTLSKALGSSSLSKRGSGFRFDGRGRQELSFKVNGENSLNIASKNESRGDEKGKRMQKKSVNERVFSSCIIDTIRQTVLSGQWGVIGNWSRSKTKCKLVLVSFTPSVLSLFIIN